MHNIQKNTNKASAVIEGVHFPYRAPIFQVWPFRPLLFHLFCQILKYCNYSLQIGFCIAKFVIIFMKMSNLLVVFIYAPEHYFFSLLSPMKILFSICMVFVLFDFILLRLYLIHSCPEFVLLSKTCRGVAQQASLRRAFAFELFHHDQLKFRLEFAFFSSLNSELKES